ncbi:MFS transporter [Corynebacterium propinquum]
MERSHLLKTRARNLVFAVVASALGDGLIPTAFAIQSFKLDSSGRLLTFVLIALWSAKLISSLALDKIPTPVFPARIMVLSDFGRALAQAGLLVYLVFFPNFLGPALIISSFLYGFFAPWFGPNRFSLLAAILTGEERRKINSLLSAICDALFLAGPLLGSALTLGLGFKAVLAVDTLTFAISMAFIASYWSVRSKSGHQEEPEEETAGNSPEKSAIPHIRLPRWAVHGLVTWLIVATTIGFIGSAAPTSVMDRFSESTWGWIASVGAAGSLVGSLLSSFPVWKKVHWNFLQIALCAAYAGHLLALFLSSSIYVIAIATVLSGALTAISGITWDVLGQELPSDDLVNRFAVRDQIVNTVGIPVGMLLFAFLANANGISLSILLVFLSFAVLVCLVPKSVPQQSRP